MVSAPSALPPSAAGITVSSTCPAERHSRDGEVTTAATPSTSSSALFVSASASTGAITSNALTTPVGTPVSRRSTSASCAGPSCASRPVTGVDRLIVVAMPQSSNSRPPATAITETRRRMLHLASLSQPRPSSPGRGTGPRRPAARSRSGSTVSVTRALAPAVTVPPRPRLVRSGIGSTIIVARPAATAKALTAIARPEVRIASRTASSASSPATRASRHRLVTMSA